MFEMAVKVDVYLLLLQLKAQLILMLIAETNGLPQYSNDSFCFSLFDL